MSENGHGLTRWACRRRGAQSVLICPPKRDNADMGYMLAADGAQNGKYVSLPHQSGAAAGKPTH
jgi:hypothetical protein